MTAAPVNMVAMRMSCPGQSTKETCLRFGGKVSFTTKEDRYAMAHLSSFMVPPHPGRSQAGLGGVAEPYDL